MKGHAKCKNSRFELSCGSLRRNVHGSSMARWKARGWLPIDANCIFLASSHGCGTIKRNLSKSAFFDGGGSLRAQILGRRTSHAIHLWTIIEEWCVYSYNNEAGSFHTKKLCCRLFSTEVEIHLKKIAKSRFVPPVGGLRGNVHGSSVALWNARGDFLLALIELFSPALRVQALWANIGRNRVVRKGVGHFERKFPGKRGLPPTNFGFSKLDSLGYHVVLFAWSYA